MLQMIIYFYCDRNRIIANAAPTNTVLIADSLLRSLLLFGILLVSLLAALEGRSLISLLGALLGVLIGR